MCDLPTGSDMCSSIDKSHFLSTLKSETFFNNQQILIICFLTYKKKKIKWHWCGWTWHMPITTSQKPKWHLQTACFVHLLSYRTKTKRANPHIWAAGTEYMWHVWIQNNWNDKSIIKTVAEHFSFIQIIDSNLFCFSTDWI